MNKKQVIAALLENIENQRADFARYREERNKAMFELNEKLMASLSEIARLKSENNELLLVAESQFKEYIEDTTANLSQEQHLYFRPLFNIKVSLENLRSTEEEGKLSDRMRQVLAYVYKDAFVEFFYSNKGLLFDILARVQPGCTIEPKISK